MATFKRRKNRKRPSNKQAEIGTALIHSYVSNSKTREEDRLALNAMKNSVWTVILSNNTTTDKAHWAAAGMLAAYNLGRMGLISQKYKKVETP